MLPSLHHLLALWSPRGRAEEHGGISGISLLPGVDFQFRSMHATPDIASEFTRESSLTNSSISATAARTNQEKMFRFFRSSWRKEEAAQMLRDSEAQIYHIPIAVNYINNDFPAACPHRSHDTWIIGPTWDKGFFFLKKKFLSPPSPFLLTNGERAFISYERTSCLSNIN